MSTHQRQSEMDFEEKAELVHDDPTEADLTEVHAVLNDLDQLEGEVSEMSKPSEVLGKIAVER